MFRWGDEKTLRFIQIYRRHECLWNTNSRFYKHNQARDRAYRSILHEFNDKYLDLKSVKVKIKNLRSVYHSELKKIKDVTRYGFYGKPYKPSLSWFNEMDSFLGEFVADRHGSANAESGSICIEVELTQPSRDNTSSTSTIPEEETTAELEQVLIEQNADLNLDSHTVIKSEPVHTNLKDCSSSIPAPSPVRISSQTPNPRIQNRRKRPRQLIYNALQRLEHAVVNTTQQKLTMEPAKEDEFHVFALSVAAQLRQLPLHIAVATQTKIQSTLSEARIASIFPNTSSQPVSVIIKTEDISDAD